MSGPIGRREFLKLTGLGAAALLLPSIAWSATDKRRANVLFIAVDDMNDWIEPLGGHPNAITPNMARLAERSVLFTNTQCPAPLCNASRAALLTGVRPHNSGVYSNHQPWRWAMPDVVTLPQHFMGAGYHVAGAGKIYHGRFPDPPSWDAYWPDMIDTNPGGFWPPKKDRPLNGIKPATPFDWGPVDVSDEKMGDWQVASWIAAEVHKAHDAPFFLAAGIFRPHLPWYVPRKYFEMFPLDKISLPPSKKDDLDDVPPAGRKIADADGDHRRVLETNNWTRAVQGYLASTTFADACVGRILDALAASRHADNTYVVLWGDHGWHLGQKLHWRKFALWEEACRCPMMIAGPGIKPGVSHRPVNLMDMYPTLIDLCGLPVRPELQGATLTPLLDNPGAAWDEASLTTFMRGNHALRSQRWRYIRYRDGSEELYDHTRDRNEWTNLAGDPAYDSVKAELAARLPKTDAPNAERRPKGVKRVVGPRK